MKRFRFYGWAVLLTLGFGCSFQPRADSPDVTGIVAQLQFAGSDQLRHSTNGATLGQVLGLPETAQLRDEAIAKLALALSQNLEPSRERKVDGSAAELLRPLLAELLRTEVHVEVTGRGKERLVSSVALRLSPESSLLWRTNLNQLVSNFRLARSWADYQLTQFTTNSWLVVSLAPKGTGSESVETSLLGHVRAKGQPPSFSRDHLLKLDIDWAKLVQLCPNLPGRTISGVKLGVAGRGANLRTESTITLSSPADWKLERWNVPTNTITDPQDSLISFTALQGFAPWLGRQKLVQELKLSPVPNQVYLWGQAYMPYQIQAAAQVGNPQNFISQFAKVLLPRINTNLYEHAVGQIQGTTNRLVWIGLPILYPYLTPGRDAEFVHAGILPVATPVTNPPPAELIRQFAGRTNLIFYDWEVTPARLAQLRELAYLTAVFATIPRMPTNSVTAKWLDAIEPKLGNSVTEISVMSPKELSLVRTSQLGLNGPELLTVAYWLSSANFPNAEFNLRFQPVAPLPK